MRRQKAVQYWIPIRVFRIRVNSSVVSMVRHMERMPAAVLRPWTTDDGVDAILIMSIPGFGGEEKPASLK